MVGFGGTVNMVVGLLYLVVVVGATAGPVHAAGLARGLTHSASAGDPVLPGWAFLGLPAGLLLGAVAVWLPLRAGARSLRGTEF